MADLHFLLHTTHACVHLLSLLRGVHLYGTELTVQRLALVEKGLRQLGGVRVDPAVQEAPLAHGLRRDRAGWRGSGALHGRRGWWRDWRRHSARRPGETGRPRPASWTGAPHHVRRPEPRRRWHGTGSAESRLESESWWSGRPRRSWWPRRSALMKRRTGATVVEH